MKAKDMSREELALVAEYLADENNDLRRIMPSMHKCGAYDIDFDNEEHWICPSCGIDFMNDDKAQIIPKMVAAQNKVVAERFMGTATDKSTEVIH